MLFLLWNADAVDVVVFSFLFLPWLAGPAALAAIGARLAAADSAAWAWAFFILEALVVASTIWVWFDLIVIAPDAQNGVGMLLFPVVQYGAVLVFFLVAVLITVLTRPGGGFLKQDEDG